MTGCVYRRGSNEWPAHGECDLRNPSCRLAWIRSGARNDLDCYKSRTEPEDVLWLCARVQRLERRLKELSAKS